MDTSSPTRWGNRMKLLLHDGSGLWCAARRFNQGGLECPVRTPGQRVLTVRERGPWWRQWREVLSLHARVQRLAEKLNVSSDFCNRIRVHRILTTRGHNADA